MSSKSPIGYTNVAKFAAENSIAIPGSVMVDVKHTKDDFRTSVGGAIWIPFADCHPVFVYHKDTKTAVGIHTGWKSILDGVIPEAMKWVTWPKGVKLEELCAWIGPGLSQDSFEIKEDVAGMIADKYITRKDDIHWRLNMKAMIVDQLMAEGILHENIEFYNEDTLNSEYFSRRTDLKDSKNPSDKSYPVDTNMAVLSW